MFNSDLVIGLSVGSIQGYLFGPIYGICYKFTAYLIKKISSSTAITLIVGNLMGLVGAGGFLLTVLFFSPFVVVWKTFVLGWTFGFIAGPFIYSITHRKKRDEW